ncbi:hypothetical protein [Streptomyces sp. CC228A]|nr:hypothetical protein [Streptomyces sp. CC228A]
MHQSRFATTAFADTIAVWPSHTQTATDRAPVATGHAAPPAAG